MVTRIEMGQEALRDKAVWNRGSGIFSACTVDQVSDNMYSDENWRTTIK